MAKIKKGQHLSPNTEFKKGFRYWLGKKRPPFSEKWKEKKRINSMGNKSRTGMKNTLESNEKRRLWSLKYGFKNKENHPNWRGGITLLDKKIRTSLKYRQWRSDIFTRDNFTCQYCGKNHCWIEAHHLKEFNKILEENKIKTLEQALTCEEL